MPTPPKNPSNNTQPTPASFKAQKAVAVAIKDEDYKTALKLYQATPELSHDQSFLGKIATIVLDKQSNDEDNISNIDQSNERLAFMSAIFKSNPDSKEINNNYNITRRAIRLQDTKFLKLVLDAGCDPFSNQEDQKYPLHAAVKTGRPDSLKMLLEHLENHSPDLQERQQWVQQRDKFKKITPLALALENADSPKSDELIEQLLLHGAADPVIDNKYNILAEPMTFRQMHAKLEELKNAHHHYFMESEYRNKNDLPNRFPMSKQRYMKGVLEMDKVKKVIERHTPQLALAPAPVEAGDMDFTKDRLETPPIGENMNPLLAQR